MNRKMVQVNKSIKLTLDYDDVDTADDNDVVFVQMAIKNDHPQTNQIKITDVKKQEDALFEKNTKLTFNFELNKGNYLSDVKFYGKEATGPFEQCIYFKVFKSNLTTKEPVKLAESGTILLSPLLKEKRILAKVVNFKDEHKAVTNTELEIDIYVYDKPQTQPQVQEKEMKKFTK